MEAISQVEIKKIVEALLFASPEPLSIRRMVESIALPSVGESQVRAVVEQLRVEYDSQERAFEIREIAGGYQIFSRQTYEGYISRMRNISPRIRLSTAAIETLAIIAYKQPIMRSEIDSIRGVQSAPIIRNLMDMGLVRIAGRADALGNPILYGTTKKFLETFGLRSLADLPKIDSGLDTF